ncbi:uncharacterized protein EI97DRAFT_444868 [Westerdykella ornata]|uniref:Uncharacterized protein n=1 Tax=Westerdykella ornata TaxID=318751 RepID=A0A6A6JD71_WESOR|nr:uncharacterized protein EI97DRAFT_444868 [Westerdykella ornata]KAF2273576.1 hypothetical protein EI97DRAFT_444868 [Westerdykella ornata]
MPSAFRIPDHSTVERRRERRRIRCSAKTVRILCLQYRSLANLTETWICDRGGQPGRNSENTVMSRPKRREENSAPRRRCLHASLVLIARAGRKCSSDKVHSRPTSRRPAWYVRHEEKALQACSSSEWDNPKIYTVPNPPFRRFAGAYARVLQCLARGARNLGADVGKRWCCYTRVRRLAEALTLRQLCVRVAIARAAPQVRQGSPTPQVGIASDLNRSEVPPRDFDGGGPYFRVTECLRPLKG